MSLGRLFSGKLKLPPWKDVIFKILIESVSLIWRFLIADVLQRPVETVGEDFIILSPEILPLPKSTKLTSILYDHFVKINNFQAIIEFQNQLPSDLIDRLVSYVHLFAAKEVKRLEGKYIKPNVVLATILNRKLFSDKDFKVSFWEELIKENLEMPSYNILNFYQLPCLSDNLESLSQLELLLSIFKATNWEIIYTIRDIWNSRYHDCIGENTMNEIVDILEDYNAHPEKAILLTEYPKELERVKAKLAETKALAAEREASLKAELKAVKARLKAAMKPKQASPKPISGRSRKD